MRKCRDVADGRGAGEAGKAGERGIVAAVPETAF